MKKIGLISNKDLGKTNLESSNIYIRLKNGLVLAVWPEMNNIAICREKNEEKKYLGDIGVEENGDFALINLFSLRSDMIESGNVRLKGEHRVSIRWSEKEKENFLKDKEEFVKQLLKD